MHTLAQKRNMAVDVIHKATQVLGGYGWRLLPRPLDQKASGYLRKEVIQMADKKQNDCGCGCLPSTKKDSKTPKPEAKKTKKSKK